MTPCVFCEGTGGSVIWEDSLCRVVAVDEPGYPGFCRVILNRHVREMTDLPSGDRDRLMRVVLAVEAAIRQLLHPAKVNLACFGNVTPHIHWHVIPRWLDDPHFPLPFWGVQQRPPDSHRNSPAPEALGAAIEAALKA